MASVGRLRRWDRLTLLSQVVVIGGKCATWQTCGPPTWRDCLLAAGASCRRRGLGVRRVCQAIRNDRHGESGDEATSGGGVVTWQCCGGLQGEAAQHASAKKPRMKWTAQMHQQFVTAVDHLGIESTPLELAVPPPGGQRHPLPWGRSGGPPCVGRETHRWLR